MKKSVVGLASYPTSGNTWARIFIAKYAMNRQEPLPINEMSNFGTGDAVLLHYNRIAKREIDTSDIDLTLKLRTAFLRTIIANNADVNLVKTHNIRSVVRGVELIPPAMTRSAIYIVRNPLDMVMSYARLWKMDHKNAAESIGSDYTTFPADNFVVTQFLGSWSGHVKSWTGKSPYPTLVLRYEDMVARPEETFSRLVTHMGMPIDENRLERAIRFSSSRELNKQESEAGFIENPLSTERFFGKGKSGQWRDELDPTAVKIIRRDHKALMKKYGYWEA